MKALTTRQFEVMGCLDASEWRPLPRPDAIVAGNLCKPFRPAGPRYVERKDDPSRPSAQVYRLTKNGALRIQFEKERR